MKKSTTSPPFLTFGQFLAETRIAKNLDQAGLAKKLGRSQQSVSRWEAGISRPRAPDLSKIADIFNTDATKLQKLAGYADTPSGPVRSFDEPFSVDHLIPETFERFITYLLGLLHPEAKVARAGTSGHKQDGLDILVTFPDERRHSFQCKRVSQFGPAEVRRAVAAHTADADKKYLVLSRVASPQAREALRGEKDWELWDKETISQIIRTKLSPDDQIRLVDIFFQGKREALLGLPGAGAWMTLSEFFEPLSQRENPFNHTWHLQGRAKEVSELQSAIEKPDTPVVLLHGAAGMGKSRILKTVLEQAAKNHPATKIYMLSTAAELARQDLDMLGNGPKILVVDDAHDRDKLGILLHYAASHRADTHIILSTRPYAKARILREAAVYGINNIPEIVLSQLTRAEMVALIEEVLEAAEGNKEWASPIANIAGNSPLVAAMAARIVVREGIPPELAKGNADLRHLILGKFKNVLAGELDSRGNQKLVADVLDVLALVQPFHIEDPQLMELLRLATEAKDAEISRVLTLLVTGGLLFKRGHQYRLMPDLLGDYLIEEACVDHAGQLSSFANTILSALPPSLLENTLVNLGRLDWRMSGGDPGNSKLLDAMWRTLREIDDEYDPRFEAIRAVAVYQPDQTLAFVEDRLRRRRPVRGAAKIIRNVAFNHSYITRACELLWEMGRNDRRELGQTTDHPIRLLSDMCGFEEKKPLAYVEPVFEFGMKLLKRHDVWNGCHTPLDILKPILSGEGLTTTTRGRELVVSPFMVNYDVVAPLRRRFIDQLIILLSHPDPAVGTRIAKFLQNALHGPRGTMGARVPDELHQKYADEAAETLNAIVSKLNTLHPAVCIGLASSVSWVSRHGPKVAATAGQAVLNAMPTDLGFRVLTALSDGYGQTFIDMTDAQNWQSNVRRWIDSLVVELRNAYPEPESLLRYLNETLTDLKEAKLSEGSSHVLISALLRDNLDLARVAVKEVMANPKSIAQSYLNGALSELLEHAPAEGRAYISQFLDGADSNLAQAATAALAGGIRPREPEDIVLLRKAFGSPDPMIVQQALHSAITWQNVEPRDLLEITKLVHLDMHPDLVHLFGMLMAGSGKRLLEALTRDDVAYFLKRMMRLPTLEDYWMQQMLAYISLHYPHELTDFFFERVELAATPETFNEIRPANFGPYSNVPLRFAASPEAGAVLAKVWAWLRKNEERDFYFQHHAADVFDAMFISSNGDTVSDDMVALFESRIETASPVELNVMARILRHADNQFVFRHRPFVVRLLDRCNDADPEVLRLTIGELHASAVSGVRTSTPGEPAPLDVEMLEAAEKAIKEVSRLSPAFDLYNDIRRTSEWNIKRSREDGALFEE